VGAEYARTCRADNVSFRMFETNMDEYLDEETEWVKAVMEGICKNWEQQVRYIHLHHSDRSARQTRELGRIRSCRSDLPKRLESRSSQTESPRWLS